MDLFTLQSTLTRNESMRLDELETTIDAGLKTFVDVGLALMEIRDGRLYRESYGTFEDYCRGRWNFTRMRASQLISAAEVVENVNHGLQTLPENERQARVLAQLPPETQAEAWKIAVETAPDGRITAAHVQSVVDNYIRKEEDYPGYIPQPSEIEKRPVSYHVSDDSYEWYTPAEYIEAARRVMGSIDLDPATSEQAQATIMAGEYYTKDDDGLSHAWFGNVWLNPPYNIPLIEQFVDRVIGEYERGTVTSAMVLTNNSTDTGWFHKLAQYPFCLTRGRIQFWNGDEKLATRQGQAIFYLGGDPDKFAKEFSAFGLVVKQYDYKQS